MIGGFIIKKFICFLSLFIIAINSFSGFIKIEFYDSKSLKVTNDSTANYCADEIEIFIDGVKEPVSIPVLKPQTSIIKIIPGNMELSKAKGNYSFTYCDDRQCFMIEDTFSIEYKKKIDYAGFEFAGILLCLILIFIFRKKKPIVITSVIILTTFFFYKGFALEQQKTMKAVSQTLCISCIGLELPSKSFPINDQYLEKVKVTGEHTIEVFHTEWCKSCPAVIDFVQRLSEKSPNIKVKIIDAEKDMKYATDKGVYKGGNLVVPTTLIDGKKTIIGSENYPDKFYNLLKN